VNIFAPVNWFAVELILPFRNQILEFSSIFQDNNFQHRETKVFSNMDWINKIFQNHLHLGCGAIM